MQLEGGCSCGAVRYVLKNEPLIVHACHCCDCQKLTGSLYAVNAWIEKEFLELRSGSLTMFRRKGGSGEGHDVHSCSACATALFNDYHRAPGSYWWVRVGTLDEPGRLRPDVHIFTRSKHPSVILPTDVPAFEAYYDRGTVWRPESLARMEASIRARQGHR